MARSLIAENSTAVCSSRAEPPRLKAVTAAAVNTLKRWLRGGPAGASAPAPVPAPDKGDADEVLRCPRECARWCDSVCVFLPASVPWT